MLDEVKAVNYFKHLVAPDKAGEFFSLFEEVMRTTSYSLVRLKVSGKEELNIQIMAEKENKSMVIKDCKILSNALVAAIDELGTFTHDYILEISSPGIDRPLTSKEDFSYWAGKNVSVKLNKPINSLKKYTGTLKGFFNEKVEVYTSSGEKDIISIKPEIIKSISIVWSPEISKPN